MKNIPKKLIKETKQIIRLRLFLNECGLGKIPLSSEYLKRLKKAVSR